MTDPKPQPKFEVKEIAEAIYQTLQGLYDEHISLMPNGSAAMAMALASFLGKIIKEDCPPDMARRVVVEVCTSVIMIAGFTDILLNPNPNSESTDDQDE